MAWLQLPGQPSAGILFYSRVVMTEFANLRPYGEYFKVLNIRVKA